MSPEQASPSTADDLRISVVLATFNGAEFLGEQLASLRRQTRLPDEVIIVDDGSVDATPSILRTFADQAPFPVQLVDREAHRGTWQSFEEGVRLSRGDLLFICDQDDRWRPEKLAIMTERLAARPDALMAFSDATLIDAEGRTIGRSRWRVAGFSPRQSRAVALDPFGPLLSRQAVSGCTLAIRAELIDALLPFPMDVHPGLPVMMYDRWMSLVASAAGPVLTVPERLVEYRIHPGQQIGIPALGVRRLMPRLALHAAQFIHRRRETNQRLAYHLAHLDEIEKRLMVSGLDSSASDARLAAAARHLRFRESLDHRRLGRVGPVTAEMWHEDGYRRFSLGAASAVADITR